jgi:hypothetical protein
VRYADCLLGRRTTRLLPPESDPDPDSKPKTKNRREISTTNEHEQLEHNLTNHAPINDDVVQRFEQVREPAKAFGGSILALCPASRERSLALTNLEQAVMWAVASIARNQEGL